jgi:hypothetical protein
VADAVLSHCNVESCRSAALLDVALVCAALGVLAFAGRRRRRGPTPALDLVFWILALSALVAVAGFAWGGVNRPFADLKLLAQLLAALLGATTLTTVGLELAPVGRPGGFDVEAARQVAVEAVAALVAVAAVFVLYVGAASSAEQSQAVRGVVVCLALTWELATAGATLNPTTADEQRSPRPHDC